MSDEKLSPERAVRLLRAKGAELEALFRNQSIHEEPNYLAADIALIAQLLADHIERSEERFGKVVESMVKLTDSVVTLKDDQYHAYQRANEAPTVYSDRPHSADACPDPEQCDVWHTDPLT